jgi:hypothetical protein
MPSEKESEAGRNIFSGDIRGTRSGCQKSMTKLAGNKAGRDGAKNLTNAAAEPQPGEVGDIDANLSAFCR